MFTCPLDLLLSSFPKKLSALGTCFFHTVQACKNDSKTGRMAENLEPKNKVPTEGASCFRNLEGVVWEGWFGRVGECVQFLLSPPVQH